jgi:hypothetical protein
MPGAYQRPAMGTAPPKPSGLPIAADYGVSESWVSTIASEKARVGC